MNRAIVLLSGGLDSTAALLWTVERAPAVAALFVDYGQPGRDGEVVAAAAACEFARVPLRTVAVADALNVGTGLLSGGFAGRAANGQSVAVVPLRNLTLIAVAAARASVLWPDGPFDLVLGCNADDASAFPDCRAEALVAAQTACCHGSGREVGVVAPWLATTKLGILNRSWTPRERAILQRSFSCYAGTACGQCDACAARSRAISSVGWSDMQAAAKMRGGDPGRDAALQAHAKLAVKP